MGLFNKKRKITIDDMAMKMMFSAVDSIGKLKGFNDLDDDQSMIVSLGYFYGFLKLHLNSITNLNTANIIIEKSIAYLENATKEKSSFEKFGDGVRAIEKSASSNMQYAMKELKENPFMGLAILYLKDLYDSATIDIGKVDDAEQNMRLLYGMVSELTKDIAIVK